MRRLVAGVALFWLVAVGAVPRPLAAIVSGEDRPPGTGRALVCALPAAGGLVTVRDGSSPCPDQSAHALAVVRLPALPAPTAAALPAEAIEAPERSLRALHRPRGPPPPI